VLNGLIAISRQYNGDDLAEKDFEIQEEKYIKFIGNCEDPKPFRLFEGSKMLEEDDLLFTSADEDEEKTLGDIPHVYYEDFYRLNEDDIMVASPEHDGNQKVKVDIYADASDFEDEENLPDGWTMPVKKDPVKEFATRERFTEMPMGNIYTLGGPTMEAYKQMTEEDKRLFLTMKKLIETEMDASNLAFIIERVKTLQSGKKIKKKSGKVQRKSQLNLQTQ